jgi:tRNA (cmo5U34)-methyltransferase
MSSEADTGYVPAGAWEFDEEVARVFDNMLERSIPAYGEMRGLVTRLALRPDVELPAILDLGCSRGEALRRVVQLRPEAEAVGLERSPPMLDAARRRFRGEARVSILEADLRDELELEDESFDVALCVLTLMFVPVEHRLRLLDETRRVLRPGGRLLLVEKVLGETHATNDLLVREYEAMKRGAGYSEQDVARKRLALEGVLVPMRASENARLLAEAGFRGVDVFWACLNFRGWIALRP